MYCSISLNSVVCPSQFSATLTSLTRPFTLDIPAEMAELADALDSGSFIRGFRKRLKTLRNPHCYWVKVISVT